MFFCQLRSCLELMLALLLIIDLLLVLLLKVHFDEPHLYYLYLSTNKSKPKWTEETPHVARMCHQYWSAWMIWPTSCFNNYLCFSSIFCYKLTFPVLFFFRQRKNILNGRGVLAKDGYSYFIKIHNTILGIVRYWIFFYKKKKL